MNLLIDNKYRLSTKIGSGSFGDVYLGYNPATREEVAIKLQKQDKESSRTVEIEQKALESVQKENGFPKIKYFAKLSSFTVLVSDLLGPNLEEVLKFCDGIFTQHTIAFIGEQILMRIRSLHKKNYIHRDIKPENFLFGLKENCDKIYMIDLGLAKKYITSKSHIPSAMNKNFVGTARFSSPSSHNGFELSRRDDLVSFCYMLIYFKKGKLPWQGITAENKNQKMEKIKEMKNQVSIELLCEKMHFSFYYMIKYCIGLSFNETPNYSEIESHLRDLKISSFPQCLLKLPIFLNDWNLYQINSKHNEIIYKQVCALLRKLQETNYDIKINNLDSINWAQELYGQNEFPIKSIEPLKVNEQFLFELNAVRRSLFNKNSRLKDFLSSSFKNLPQKYLYRISTVKKLKILDNQYYKT